MHYHNRMFFIDLLRNYYLLLYFFTGILTLE